jgi:hypothetical protein
MRLMADKVFLYVVTDSATQRRDLISPLPPSLPSPAQRSSTNNCLLSIYCIAPPHQVTPLTDGHRPNNIFFFLTDQASDRHAERSVGLASGPSAVVSLRKHGHGLPEIISERAESNLLFIIDLLREPCAAH